MSEPSTKKAAPDEDMLEFLGGIDEVNDDTQEDNFSDFLATADIDKLAGKGGAKKAPPPPPPKDEQNEQK